jgi:hypothetical protein
VSKNEVALRAYNQTDASTQQALLSYMPEAPVPGLDNIQDILGQGFNGVQAGLAQWGAKVQTNNDHIADMAADKSDLLAKLSSWPADGSKKEVKYTTYDDAGNPTEHTESLTKDEALALSGQLEEQSTKFRSMSEADTQRLQDLYQQYQQLLTLMSNISALENSTAKSIIGNLRA